MANLLEVEQHHCTGTKFNATQVEYEGAGLEMPVCPTVCLTHPSQKRVRKGFFSGFTVPRNYIPDISYTSGTASLLHRNMNIMTPEPIPQKRKNKEQIVASVPTLSPGHGLSHPPGVGCL